MNMDAVFLIVLAIFVVIAIGTAYGTRDRWRQR